ncbi:hypothetical protein AB0M57_35270 [Streptomyces sp. NPDC051597]|uniref:hypothetical protein n=1 Tax=Streptomyces sp. NPDC051597 TaxID=3155049 RepID=UPI00343EE1BA
MTTAQADQLRGASLGTAGFGIERMLPDAQSRVSPVVHASAGGGLGAWVTQEYGNQNASDQHWRWTFGGQGRKVLPSGAREVTATSSAAFRATVRLLVRAHSGPTTAPDVARIRRPQHDRQISSKSG